MKKVLLLLLLFVPVLGAWQKPEYYYYFRDKNIEIMMPRSADYDFSLDSDGQPINITGSTIYGYYVQRDIRVNFPVYDLCYYFASNNNTVVRFDPDTFETNLNLVETNNKQTDPIVIGVGLVGVLVFLQLISFNQFRVRKAREKGL